MSELLSCAHCGGTKNRVITKRAKTGYYGGGSPAYYMMAYVTCGKCHARGPVASAERIPSSFKADANAEIESLKERAAELWNRRGGCGAVHCDECIYSQQGIFYQSRLYCYNPKFNGNGFCVMPDDYCSQGIKAVDK